MYSYGMVCIQRYLMMYVNRQLCHISYSIHHLLPSRLYTLSSYILSITYCTYCTYYTYCRMYSSNCCRCTRIPAGYYYYCRHTPPLRIVEIGAFVALSSSSPRHSVTFVTFISKLTHHSFFLGPPIQLTNLTSPIPNPDLNKIVLFPIEYAYSPFLPFLPLLIVCCLYSSIVSVLGSLGSLEHSIAYSTLLYSYLPCSFHTNRAHKRQVTPCRPPVSLPCEALACQID